MKAKTDSGPTENNSKKPDYIEGLFLLMRLVSEVDVVKKFEDDFNQCSIRYGDMKKQLAEDMVKFIGPIRERSNTLYSDSAYLEKIVKQGAEKARQSATETIKMARDLMGLDYFKNRN